MDFETLNIFCDVIKLRGFTSAASAHSITQSAVSQRVKSLEKELGMILIERHSGIPKLTDGGEIVYKAAENILACRRELLERLHDLQGQEGGSVRVSTIYSVGLHELNQFVKTFLQAYPKTDVQIEYSRANKVYQDVIAGSADIGIVAYPAQRPQISVIPFHEDELVLICFPDHPLTGVKTISIKQLNGESFISFHQGVPTRKAIDKIFEKHRITVKMRAEFDNIELIKRAVEIGLGISMVPSMTVRSESRAGILIPLPLVEGPFLRPIGIIHRRGRELPKSVKNFIAMLTEKTSEEGEELNKGKRAHHVSEY